MVDQPTGTRIDIGESSDEDGDAFVFAPAVGVPKTRDEDEEHRVTALSAEPKISFTITPRELLLLQGSSPLESDDDVSEQEQRARDDGSDGVHHGSGLDG